jgi:hypothetical protein
MWYTLNFKTICFCNGFWVGLGKEQFFEKIVPWVQSTPKVNPPIVFTAIVEKHHNYHRLQSQ